MPPSLTRACAVVAFVVSLGGCGKKESAPGGGTAVGTPAPAASGGLGLAFLNGFEGEIGILFKEASKPGKPALPLALMIKDNKLRMELPADLTASSGKGYAVLNASEKKLYTVLEDKK